MAVVVDDCCFAKPTEKQNPLQHLKGIHANLPFHWTAPVNSAIGGWNSDDLFRLNILEA